MHRWLASAVIFSLTLQLVIDGQFVRATFPPEPSDGRDLLAFVTAGRIYASADPGPAGVYDLDRQRQEQETLTELQIEPGTGLPFMHPPHLLALQGWLTRFDYTSYWLFWACFSICCLLAGVGFLGRLMRHEDVPPYTVALYAMTGLAFAPFVISVVHGQDTAFVYLGIAGWLAGYIAGWSFTAGLALSLVTLRPHLAIVLAVPFVFAQRRVFAGFVAGSVMWSGVALATVGVEGALGFASAVRSVAGFSEFGVDPRPMVNIAGLVRRLLPDSRLTAARIFAWSTWLATILLLCRHWYRSRPVGGPAPADLGVAIVLSLVFSPHLNFSDLTLLHAAAVPAFIWASYRSGIRVPSVRIRISADAVMLGLLLVSLSISAAAMSSQPVSDLWLISAYALALVLTVLPLRRPEPPPPARLREPAS